MKEWLDDIRREGITGFGFFFVFAACAVINILAGWAFENLLQSEGFLVLLAEIFVAAIEIATLAIFIYAIVLRERDMGGHWHHPRIVAQVTAVVLAVLGGFMAGQGNAIGGAVLEMSLLVLLYIQLCYVLVSREEARGQLGFEDEGSER